MGLNRQTFYYHFTDKYDLLRWIYRHDALIYLETDICLENWEEQALKLLKAIKEKSHFYYTTVTSDSEVLLNVFPLRPIAYLYHYLNKSMLRII